jgi:F-type H+-transporting ATPase subunit b
MRMTFRTSSHAPRRDAIPGVRALALAVLLVLVGATGPLVAPLGAAQQPPQVPIEDADHAARGQDGVHHDESVWSVLARIANFVILFGGIGYLARGPVGGYLSSRKDQIRIDLVTAQRTRAEAAAQLEAIGARMQQLPGELEALRRRGTEEIAAEEARIRDMAEADRRRLLDLTRREIDMQLRAARRELTEHAADLAIGIARVQFARQATAEDQVRLIDRYLAQVSVHE